MFVIIARFSTGEKVYGPFETAARASAEALNKFGPNSAYSTPDWRVVQLEAAQ